MDNQEQLSAASRAEYIRLARESCNRNMNIGNGAQKNHGKYKDNKHDIKYEKQGFHQPALKQLDVPDRGLDFSTFSLKTFLIKLTIALALFLCFFLFDKFEIKISNFSSSSIQDLISSNQGIEDAQNFFVSIYEKITNSP